MSKKSKRKSKIKVSEVSKEKVPGRVKVLEYRVNPKDFVGTLISSFTGMKHSHTEMVIDDYQYNVIGGGKFGIRYYKRKIEPSSIVSSGAIDVIEINDYDFSDEDIKRMKEWWENNIKEKRVYGFIRLLLYPFTVILMGFYKWYYKATGKVWKPFFTEILKNAKTCAEACDYNIKVGGHDIFKSLYENVVYPGMFYLKYTGKLDELTRICKSIIKRK